MTKPPDPFTFTDRRHLLAAEGWLELGLPLEATGELKKITANLLGHPEVLEVRWHIHAKEKKWPTCVDIAHSIIHLAPEQSNGWIHCAFALHEMKRTQEAFNLLLPTVDKFPKVWTIPYNLACYASVLRQFDEAEKWLRKAARMGGKEVKEMAVEDPDLKPLWNKLGRKSFEME